mmetsp:Transcript_35803/g.118598  ORF Transcript_35803/g.118598 Transcript_35803/m.118598 type:complete len:619 (+) Transcript_35803:1100-2956(+)
MPRAASACARHPRRGTRHLGASRRRLAAPRRPTPRRSRRPARRQRPAHLCHQPLCRRLLSRRLLSRRPLCRPLCRSLCGGWRASARDLRLAKRAPVCARSGAAWRAAAAAARDIGDALYGQARDEVAAARVSAAPHAQRPAARPQAGGQRHVRVHLRLLLRADAERSPRRRHRADREGDPRGGDRDGAPAARVACARGVRRHGLDVCAARGSVGRGGLRGRPRDSRGGDGEVPAPDGARAREGVRREHAAGKEAVRRPLVRVGQAVRAARRRRRVSRARSRRQGPRGGAARRVPRDGQGDGPCAAAAPHHEGRVGRQELRAPAVRQAVDGPLPAHRLRLRHRDEGRRARHLRVQVGGRGAGVRPGCDPQAENRPARRGGDGGAGAVRGGRVGPVRRRRVVDQGVQAARVGAPPRGAAPARARPQDRGALLHLQGHPARAQPHPRADRRRRLPMVHPPDEAQQRPSRARPSGARQGDRPAPDHAPVLPLGALRAVRRPRGRRRRPLRRVPRPAWRRRVCPSDAAAAARAEARADDASLHALHGRARSRHPVRGDRLPRAVRAAEVRAAGPQREAAAGRRGAGAAVVRSVQAGVYVQASIPPSGRVHPPSNRAVPTNTYI